MKRFKITYWLTLIGGLFILSLGYLMDYFEVESSSYVFTRGGVSNGTLTPFGTKLIGYIVLIMWLSHLSFKKKQKFRRKRISFYIKKSTTKNS